MCGCHTSKLAQPIVPKEKTFLVTLQQSAERVYVVRAFDYGDAERKVTEGLSDNGVVNLAAGRFESSQVGKWEVNVFKTRNR